MNPAKKTDADLRGAETRFERLSQLSGALVFIGLLIEVWGAVKYRPSGAPFTQTWEPAVSGVLVAIGVFFEILFGRWALQQGAELRQRAEWALAEATERAGRAISRAALAEERAAEASRKAEEEKTARLKLAIQFGARTLTDDDAAKLRDALKGKYHLN